MARRHDDQPIQRRRPTRQPKFRILAICEGEKTEPLYLKDLKNHARNPLIHIEALGAAGDPITVVETAIKRRRAARDEAKRLRDENLLWDQVWAVFDVDDHPRLDDALKLAAAGDIQLAVSNPCFELWGLLHFADQRGHIDRKKLRAALRLHLPRYDKELPFGKMHPGYDDAVRRARELDQQAERAGRPGRNPTTGVHLLTEIIRTR